MTFKGVTAASAALLVMQIACGGSQDRRADTLAADTLVSDVKAASLPVANPALAAVPPRDTVSMYPLTWTVDIVLERLVSAGLSPRLGGAVKEKFMSLPGTRVSIPGAELEVFVYGSATMAAQDIDRFYKLMRMPDGALMWKKPPALVTANNMVILVLTDDTALRERVRDVLHLSDAHASATER